MLILVLGAALVGGLWIMVRRSHPGVALDNRREVATVAARAETTAAPTTDSSPIADTRRQGGGRVAGSGAPPPARDAPGLVPAEGMSPGLAQDLEMFNNDQLRAELESIALSYPAVTLVTAFCATRPCHAEVASQDVEQMNQYVEMVTNRFQGHVATRFETRPSPSGRDLLHAVFTIGTPVRHTLARYAPAP